MSEQMSEVIREMVRDFTEGKRSEEDGEYYDPLSIDLRRSIVVWITYGGPNIWIEIPVEHGPAKICGSWGSDRAEYALSLDEENAVLESLGIYDIEEYARSMGVN
jgi:hypothetical protein